VRHRGIVALELSVVSQPSPAAPGPLRLVDRSPHVSADDLIAGLVPPPLFATVSFDSYRPDPAHPSQAEAVVRLRAFPVRPRGRGGGFLRKRAATGAGGIYLDGGFGVGKTHLLASLWHAAPAPKAYATFVELTHLAGALGFNQLVDLLSDSTLLAIDEFELDDPGDTVLVSTLLARLSDRGVALAATSNTLPDRLGEDRFATDDFIREIQALAARFTSIRVDGPDYRHRGFDDPPPPPTDDDVIARATKQPGASLDRFDELLTHLATLHPSRYGALLDGIAAVNIVGGHELPDQNMALRLVVLADRLYDRQIPFALSGPPIAELFSPDMLAGGYRKKYRRAVSRLVALSRLA
jgi:cell division protein ZapE